MPNSGRISPVEVAGLTLSDICDAAAVGVGMAVVGVGDAVGAVMARVAVARAAGCFPPETGRRAGVGGGADDVLQAVNTISIKNKGSQCLNFI